MRWIVRKVVEFVIDALLESDKLDDLLLLIAKRIIIPSSKTIETATGVIKEKLESIDEIGSEEEIAKMIISGSSRIQMSDISEGSEEVTKAGDDHKGVMDLLKNIGD